MTLYAATPVECSAAAGCTPRTLGCVVAGAAVNCTRVGITGPVVRIDLSGLTDQAPATLILTGNNVVSLGSGCITGADGSLTTLVVRGNAIVTVDPDTLRTVPNLQNLDLSDNSINAVHVTTLNTTTSLISVNLGGNSIGALPELLFRPTPSIQSVYGPTCSTCIRPQWSIR